MFDPRCVWPVAAMLGEGPAWDGRTGHLWFVDIKRGHLHRFDPATGEGATRDVGGAPCFVLPAEGDGLLLGNGHALHHLRGGGSDEVVRIDMPARNRLNDATVDGDGRIWFGSMDDDERGRTGALYLYDRGEVTMAGGAAVVTNGPAVTADGRWLYHVDTADGIVWRFDVSASSTLAGGIAFARFDTRHEGSPDGVVLDAEDHLWVALWGGGGVRRYAPDGRLVREVALPCRNITKLAFGGADLATAYVTSARVGLGADDLAAEPLSGGLFAFEVDVPGRALPLARIG